MNLKHNYLHYLSRSIALFLVPCHSLLFPASVFGDEIPAYAEITQILGPNNVSLRVNGRPTPTNVGDQLQRAPDALYLPGDDRTFANLDFYNRSGQSAGTRVQTRTRNQLITLYYFPCTLSIGGSAIIEWTNQSGGRRGCDTGFRIQSSPRRGAQMLEDSQPYAWQPLKQMQAQTTGSRFQYYCSVASDSGAGWVGVTASGDPCQVPLQQCQAQGKDCVPVTLDRWIGREPELIALVTCQADQVFTAQGTGATMPDVVSQLWQQAQAQGARFCGLHVLTPEESIALPAPSGERTLVQVRDTEPCHTFDVISGAVSVRSVKRPEGVALQPGQRYRYCDQTTDDPIETFDPAIESIELQVFLAPERGYQLCDQQQASGGQAGDRRTIQLTATEGELRIDYEMYQVPDRLEVTYEGRTLVDTDFVSGSDRLSVPFQGNSGQVTVSLTGNVEIASTRWDYTLYCP